MRCGAGSPAGGDLPAQSSSRLRRPPGPLRGPREAEALVSPLSRAVVACQRASALRHQRLVGSAASGPRRRPPSRRRRACGTSGGPGTSSTARVDSPVSSLGASSTARACGRGPVWQARRARPRDRRREAAAGRPDARASGFGTRVCVASGHARGEAQTAMRAARRVVRRAPRVGWGPYVTLWPQVAGGEACRRKASRARIGPATSAVSATCRRRMAAYLWLAQACTLNSLSRNSTNAAAAPRTRSLAPAQKVSAWRRGCSRLAQRLL